MSAATGGELSGLRILVADDELFLAMELEDLVTSFGGTPVGPVARVSEIRSVARQQHLHAAILDVNLAGERSYAVAQELRDAGVAVVFVTGYSRLFGCPAELSDAPRVEKPFTSQQIVAAVATALRRKAGGA